MSLGELRSTAQHWLGEGRAAVVVEVIAARGSVPRGEGTRMLVAADQAVGTIGGGHLELQAIERARQMLILGTDQGSEQQVPLGPTLGQCCGGALTLRYRALAPLDATDWPEPASRFTLQLYGAGHVGRAIAQLLATLPCQVQWIDEREEQFPPLPLPPHIRKVCVEPVQAEVDVAPPGAFYLVLTHSHELDERITEAILRRGDFAFLGLIGSKTKRARFAQRLESRGIPPDTIARITCPIGLPGIAGKEPEVIALAVVAQLLSLTGP